MIYSVENYVTSGAGLVQVWQGNIRSTVMDFYF